MIVAGFGFRAAASEESLRDALHRAAGAHPVDALAALTHKAETPAFLRFAAATGLPVHHIAPEAATAAPTITQSAAAHAAHGTGSVAEASALCAVGVGGRLIQPRVISTDRMATCALAQVSGTGETP